MPTGRASAPAARYACLGGHVTCNQSVGPAPRSATARDNDCDGVIDNGNPGGGAGLQHVRHRRRRVRRGHHDRAPAARWHCDRQRRGPSAEICDGKDNDCDGVIDNGRNPAACGGSAGSAARACATRARSMCCGRRRGRSASGAVSPTVEICDGLDNDCDGVVDNGFDLRHRPPELRRVRHVCSLPHAFAGCAGGARPRPRARSPPARRLPRQQPRRERRLRVGPCTITGPRCATASTTTATAWSTTTRRRGAGDLPHRPARARARWRCATGSDG